MDHAHLAAVARGDKPAQIVLKQASIINVFDRSIQQADIAIESGIIVGIGSYQGQQEIDCTNRFVSPGFIDGHVHIESSMLTPTEFSKIVIPKGTTSIIADPHEIVNVSGTKGLRFMIESASQTPLDIHFMIPSCVPATKYETSGATINHHDVEELRTMNGILGLGEVMDYPSVIHAEEDMMKKIDVMKGMPIDGHAPDVTEKELNAYVLPGIETDHECTSIDEMIEKLQKGLYIHLREGSATRNVATLVPGVTPSNSHRTLFCTDDKHPMDIEKEGHINYNINLAISCGLDPLIAIQMATINAAQCYKLKQLGAIAPGYRANLVVFDDLQSIHPSMVLIDGNVVAENDTLLIDIEPYIKQDVLQTVHLSTLPDLTLHLQDDYVKVIQLVENNVITKRVMRHVTVQDGVYQNDPFQDIIKIAIVERHHNTGNVGIGLLEGYGIQESAVAMTIAHDSHNIVVAGDNDKDMLLAIKQLQKQQGGIVIVHNGDVVGSLVLEVGGLMTNQNARDVSKTITDMEQVARALGVHPHVDDPFVSLAFMSLPVIPDLVVTDMGLFDVKQFRHVPIEGEGS